MKLLDDWRFLLLCFVVASGLWGFFLKIIMRNLDWKSTMFYVWMTILIMYLLFVFRKINFGFTKSHWLAVLTGIIAGLGTIAFYKCISLKPASIVVPLSVQYVLITAILCWIFLKEPFSLRILIGILCGIVSVILLSK